MSTDIQLDAGEDENNIVFQAVTLQSEAAEFHLDNPTRRKIAGGRRRALVHDSTDGLTINFNGDYPAGVTIWNTSLNLRVVEQEGPEPKLPRNGVPGTLLLLLNRSGPLEQKELQVNKISLWLCVGRGGGMINLGDSWVAIPLGEPVLGTE